MHLITTLLLLIKFGDLQRYLVFRGYSPLRYMMYISDFRTRLSRLKSDVFHWHLIILFYKLRIS